MINFYFVIDKEMIEKYGMPVNNTDAGTWYWELDDSLRHHFNNLWDNPGDALNAIKALQACEGYTSFGKEYAICQASAKLTDILRQISNGLSQENSNQFPVIISDITWIK